MFKTFGKKLVVLSMVASLFTVAAGGFASAATVVDATGGVNVIGSGEVCATINLSTSVAAGTHLTIRGAGGAVLASVNVPVFLAAGASLTVCAEVYGQAKVLIDQATVDVGPGVEVVVNIDPFAYVTVGLHVVLAGYANVGGIVQLNKTVIEAKAIVAVAVRGHVFAAVDVG